MSSINNGGPAFPEVLRIKGTLVRVSGMTLRDYFAAKAMQAFCQEYVHDNSDVIADKAYALADAMLRAREAK